MTVAEPWPADGPRLSEDDLDAAAEPARLHQPWRAALAGIEVVVALVLALTGWWLWGRGYLPVHLPGTPDTHRLVGSWLSLAVAAVTIAALLGLDAIRQTVLAVRTRR